MKKLSHLLDRVARVRDPQRLAHDRVAGRRSTSRREQVVELVLARAVLGHQPLERRGLVGGVVVDVHVRVRGEPLVEEVDELPRTRAAPRRGRAPRTR